MLTNLPIKIKIRTSCFLIYLTLYTNRINGHNPDIRFTPNVQNKSLFNKALVEYWNQLHHNDSHINFSIII